MPISNELKKLKIRIKHIRNKKQTKQLNKTRKPVRSISKKMLKIKKLNQNR